MYGGAESEDVDGKDCQWNALVLFPQEKAARK